MTLATCPECGTRFHRAAGETWKTLCPECFKESKRREVDVLLAENAELRRELAHRRLCPPAVTIPPEMLSRMIRLCHPDKHNGSEAANVATAWLLAQRGRA